MFADCIRLLTRGRGLSRHITNRRHHRTNTTHRERTRGGYRTFTKVEVFNLEHIAHLFGEVIERTDSEGRGQRIGKIATGHIIGLVHITIGGNLFDAKTT